METNNSVAEELIMRTIMSTSYEIYGYINTCVENAPVFQSAYD